MKKCHIDIETRSRVDLKTAGVYNYAKDLSTAVLCVSYALDDGDVRSWRRGQPFPDDLREIFADESVMLYAHNAQFERLLFWYVLCPDYDLPEPALERFYCTAAQARANALPGGLGDCARCLGAAEQKDKRGEQLIKLLSIPRDDGSFLEDDDLMQEFSDYCAQDVRTERSISSVMRELTLAELQEYWVSEQINDRGVRVDVEFANAVYQYSDAEQEDLKRQTAILTKGEVTTPRSPKMVELIHRLLPDTHKHYVETKRTKSGLTLDSNAVDALVDVQHELPPLVADLVELKALAANSSVSKFKTMAQRADPEDDRVYGAFLLFGAAQTHRFSSRGLQLHNMPRLTAEDPATLRDQIMAGGMDPAELMVGLKSMIRPTVQSAPGKVFVCLDWSGIEARGLPWLSADRRAESVLDVFRSGEDIYLVTAEMMGEERLVGKVATLAMGYEGGVGAFQSMARNYSLDISDAQADEYKFKWRRANPWAPDFWKALQAAAFEAVRTPGTMVPVGRLHYACVPGALNGMDTLFCVLPSGTMLAYPDVRAELVDGKFGPRRELTCIKASRKPAEKQPDWPRMSLYGGLLAENATQGMCGDLLRDALVRTSEWSDEIVMHVHDEIVLEVFEEFAEDAMEDLREEMLVVPEWATGLPLDVSGWIGSYYRK